METDYADACPIATVALEVSSSSEPMRQACAEVFAGWIASASGAPGRSGDRRGRARELAIAMLSGLEGAFVLSRALRSTEPVLSAGDAAAATVRAELAQPRALRARTRADVPARVAFPR